MKTSREYFANLKVCTVHCGEFAGPASILEKSGVAYPEPRSRAFLPLHPGPGWKKSESRMNIPDHISEKKITIFSVKNIVHTVNSLLRIRIRSLF